MANEITLRATLQFEKGGSKLPVRNNGSQNIDVAGTLHVDKVVSTVPAGTEVDKGSLSTIGFTLVKNLSDTYSIIGGDDGTNYPLKWLPGEEYPARLNGNALHLKPVDTVQTETFTTVADASDSLDGKYLQLNDDVGTVAVWIDTDDSGTAIPAGASGLDRALEVTTIVTDDTAASVATKVAAVINADSKFSAVAVDSVVTVTHANAGVVTGGADGAQPTGFTSFTVTTSVLAQVSLIEE